MTVTGATPLAVKAEVGRGAELEVSGLTKKVYKFDKGALNAFASVYMRTREVSTAGKFEGTYRYSGIPVLNILEGIAPEKPKDAAFDRPLDMIVTFISESGEKRHFGYGEITMTTDENPVILAYIRKPLMPSKEDKEKPYGFNIHKGDLKGLRLICPAESDTGRYLDNVVKIVLRDLNTAHPSFPVMKKGLKCSSEGIKTLHGSSLKDLNTAGVKPAAINGWVRTGHGRGYKGISTASGYEMRDLLKKNFTSAGPDKYFLFIACDGYRTIFSGREIFMTDAGSKMMLIKDVDGKPAQGGMSLGPVADYYVDRETWGLTHIVMLESVE